MAMPFWLKPPDRSNSVKNYPFLAFLSLDRFSLIDASSTVGDNFLMLETPKSSNEQSDVLAEHKTQASFWARWVWK